METRFLFRHIELPQNIQGYVTYNRTMLRQQSELSAASGYMGNSQVKYESTSAVTFLGRPNMFVGFVAESGNCMTVATLSGVSAS